LNADQTAGVSIVSETLSSATKQIAENAGINGAVVVEKVMESKDYNFGYNAQTGEYGDMLKMGIVDPALVVKTALQAAASTAGVMLTTGCVIAEIPEDKPAAAPQMPMM
jgi:chaperonin GroEL